MLIFHRISPDSGFVLLESLIGLLVFLILLGTLLSGIYVLLEFQTELNQEKEIEPKESESGLTKAIVSIPVPYLAFAMRCRLEIRS